jgi:phage-related tail fiber protein
MAQTYIRGGQILAGSITNTQVNFGAPVAGTDVVNKQYLEAYVGGLNLKQAVKVATTGHINIGSVYPLDTIDGRALSLGDRILVKDQSQPQDNGIYVVQANGYLIRSSDADTSAELKNMVVFVSEGIVNADSGWKLTTDGDIEFGVTALTYSKFTSSVSSSNFVYNSTPSGTVDGGSTVFALASTPVSTSVQVYLNGLLQDPAGEDYTLSGSYITFTSAPLPGDKVRASYIAA